MQYIFDAPQWQWTRAYEPANFCGIDNGLKIWDIYQDNHKLILVNVPAEFLRYLQGLHKKMDMFYVNIRIEQLESGADFIYYYKGHKYYLWHYRNLPPALNPEIESIK